MADHNAFSGVSLTCFIPLSRVFRQSGEGYGYRNYYIQKYLIYYQDFEKKKVASAAPGPLTMLKNHSWPGNFKQMEQVLLPYIHKHQRNHHGRGRASAS